MDLGGDVRANPKLSGTKHNVFGIQTGVAISFMVKRAKAKGCRIYYSRRPDLEEAAEKLAFLGASRVSSLTVDEVSPDAKHNWINLSENDFDSLLPIASKEAKLSASPQRERAIFKLHSMGAITARDEWVCGRSDSELTAKVQYLVDAYNDDRKRLRSRLDDPSLAEDLDYSIKWTRSVKRDLVRNVEFSFDPEAFTTFLYRPFTRKRVYFGKSLIEMPNQMPAFFPSFRQDNVVIFFSDRGSRALFSPLASRDIAEFHLAASSDGFQGVGLYRFAEDGRRVDNITDWALDQFRKQYQPGRGKKDRPITKEAIFHYVYGVLHDPIYREKYALNLKREFPRIPFYADFWQWADWGKALMDLHIGYETVAPYPLTRVDLPDEKARAAKQSPKAMLKADKQTGCIVLDSETTLRGVPPAAWEYRLGNRSALEWVLDQHKEKKPKDPTIREKFDTYRFADYKEKVIDLLSRVTTVSVRTVEIVEAMRLAKRS
jgi:predicted helicase